MIERSRARGLRPEVMRAKRHILECHAAAIESTLSAVRRQSYFPASKRESFYTDGAVSPWSYDMRVPLSKSEYLKPICSQIIEILQRRGIRQVAGKGYGSFLLIGGIVAGGENFRAGLVRGARKSYGFRRRVEGDLSRSQPVYIVDDILSTGRSVASVAGALLREGFRPAGVVTVFRFGWEDAGARLGKYNIEAECLATLRMK